MDEPQPRTPLPEFDKTTNHLLRTKLSELLRKKNPDLPNRHITELVEDFLLRLRCLADTVPDFEKSKLPKQQKRKEGITSMAKALLRCIDQFEALDDGCQDLVFYHGIEAIAKAAGESNPLQNNFSTSLLVAIHKTDYVNELKAFADGALTAAKAMPAQTEKSTELKISLAIEDLFLRCGFPYSTSKDSFAGECVRAVLALGGIEKDRVDHLLIKARDDQDSMTTLINRMKSRRK